MELRPASLEALLPKGRSVDRLRSELRKGLPGFRDLSYAPPPDSGA
jgi:hypothetical protein